MIYGYARVSTDGQSVDAQVRQLRAAGCKTVFREVASGAKTDRDQLRRILDALDPRPVDHVGDDYRQGCRVSLFGRRMGRHHHAPWPLDAHRPWRPGGVRARVDAAQLVRRFYGCAVTALTGSLW